MSKCKTCGRYNFFTQEEWKDKEVAEAKFEHLKDERFVNVWITAKSSYATSTINIVMPVEGVAVIEKAIKEFKAKKPMEVSTNV